MSQGGNRTASKEGLCVPGVLIGIVGCVIITASSVYTALKMGALPWPTIFTSIVSLVLLRAFRHTSLNEANVTQIIMSAGSMVAGGLAFTIPAAWMLGAQNEVSVWQMLFVALAGTLLGLVCTALIRRRFVEESNLEYPIGVAAAKTLAASKAGKATVVRLAGSMGVAGLWTVARDVLGIIPTLLCTLPIPGVSFGFYNSPMMLSVGFLVGGTAVAFWLGGALLGNLGITVAAPALGLCDVTYAQGIVSSLGMGLMMGSGFGVVVHDIAPAAVRYLKSGQKSTASPYDSHGIPRIVLGFLIVLAAVLVCWGLDLGPVATITIILLGFVATIMSAQSVGQTGIDPMEIFGVIVLLAVAVLGESSQVKLIFVAAVVAIACGLGGDVMSDFKTGHIIGTDPRKMWIGQAIGSLIGVGVSVAVMMLLMKTYGITAFGPGKLFVSAQASVVATMIAGIPNLGAFVLGIVAGIVLYCLGIPAMMLGLGVYLPLYLSLTAPLGTLAKIIYDRVGRKSTHSGKQSELNHDDQGTLVASGLLGGESIVGVIIALVAVASGLVVS